MSLDTGYMFVTPVLTQNKTYYVEMNDLIIIRDTFYFTGSLQMFTVPANVTQLHVDMYGAQGAGNLTPENVGGLGGRVRFTMPVSTSEVYYLAVGGKGNLNLGGFNGGGGCTTNPTCNAINGYGGGGASDIRTSISWSDRIAVAGGGGGAGFLGSGVNAQGVLVADCLQEMLLVLLLIIHI